MAVISFDDSKPSSILSTAGALASAAVDLPLDVDIDKRGESDLRTTASSVSSTEPGLPSTIAGDTTRADGPGATLAPAIFAQDASATGGGSSGAAPDQGSIWAAAAGSGVTIVVGESTELAKLTEPLRCPACHTLTDVADHVPVLVLFGVALWGVKRYGNKKKERLEKEDEERSGKPIDLRPESDRR